MSKFDLWWKNRKETFQSRTIRDWAQAGWEASKAQHAGEIVDLVQENKQLREKIASPV